jgi:tetratricopeptide (TPR) repeat protein
MIVSRLPATETDRLPSAAVSTSADQDPEKAAHYLMLGHQISQEHRYGEAETCFRKALELSPNHPMAHNNLGWVRQMQGHNDEAVEGYQRALQLDPRLRIARRNLAVLLVRIGLREKSVQLWRDELLSGPEGLAWLDHLAATSMQAKDLTLAGEFASLLAQAQWGSEFYPPLSAGVAARLPVKTPTRFLTVPKLQHDIEQFQYLQRNGILGAEFTCIIHEYQRTIDRLTSRGVASRVPLDEEAEQTIGHVYNRIVYVRNTPRVKQAFSNEWAAEDVEKEYVDNSPGVVVMDNFLSGEALEGLRLFCLESTVWSGNRYAHGRLGAFFRDGFNCSLLLQIAEELRAKLPRVIGDKYPLRQLWGFKNGQHLPGDSTTHADFAAVNVNFWITPTSANLDESTGGLVIYGVDAPAHWDFDSYNSRPDRIQPFLRQQEARSVTIPYRQNRAIIFNSDLFHATSELNFKPGYENRRINITMLYGDREHDVHHRRLARKDSADATPAGGNSWRSAAFGRTRRF